MHISDPHLHKKIIDIQRLELTEYLIYEKLEATIKREKDRAVLKKIADEEKTHYEFWKNLSGQEVTPYRLKVHLFTFLSRFFGLNFGLRLMEKEESGAQMDYAELISLNPKVEEIMKEEEEHEQQLLALMSQAELLYAGSIILGLNDALVELTGVLVGLTLALQDGRIVAIAAFITGIAAAFSMAASEYLSTKEELVSSSKKEEQKNPLRACIYTGIAYITVVLILIQPYFFVQNVFLSLGISLGLALAVILVFNFYISIAKNLPFHKKFIEMASISLGVAILNFIIGFLVRQYLQIEA